MYHDYLGSGCVLIGGLAYSYETHIQVIYKPRIHSEAICIHLLIYFKQCPVTHRRRFVALTPDQVKKLGNVEFSQLLDQLKGDIVSEKVSYPNT